MVAGKLANLGRGRPSEIPPIGGITASDAAAKLNVGTRSVERAREVIDNGAPELVQAVERGEVSVRHENAPTCGALCGSATFGQPICRSSKTP